MHMKPTNEMSGAAWAKTPSAKCACVFGINQIKLVAEHKFGSVKPFLTDPANKLALLKVETTHSKSRSQLSR